MTRLTVFLYKHRNVNCLWFAVSLNCTQASRCTRGVMQCEIQSADIILPSSHLKLYGDDYTWLRAGSSSPMNEKVPKYK